MDSFEKRERFRKLKNGLLIFLIVFIIAVPTFTYFKISTDSHLALREAKNIRLAFDMLNVEYYGNGKTIADAHSLNGLADGVEERLQEVTEKGGDIRLLSYDKKNRKVRSFTYEINHVRVTYYVDSDNKDIWEIDYIIRIEEYGKTSQDS